MEPIYRPILKKAWEITWRFKYLWFFGLFASLLGSGGIYNINLNVDEASNQGNWIFGLKEFLSGGGVYGAAWQNMGANMNWWLVILFLLLVVVGLFLLWLAVVSQGSLFYGAREGSQGRILTFGEVFKKGKEKFWPLLLLNIIMGLVALAILIIVTLPFLILMFKPEYATTAASLFVAISLVIMVPLGVMITFIVRYGFIFIANKDRSPRAAISEAASMFRKNWLTSLEMMILIWVVYVVLGLILSLIARVILLPLLVYIFTLFSSTYTGSETLTQAVITGGLFVYMVIMLWAAAVMNVFENSCWVLLFERLNNDEVESKVVRLVTAALVTEKQPSPVLTPPMPIVRVEKPIVARKAPVKRVVRKKPIKNDEMAQE